MVSAGSSSRWPLLPEPIPKIQAALAVPVCPCPALLLPGLQGTGTHAAHAHCHGPESRDLSLVKLAREVAPVFGGSLVGAQALSRAQCSSCPTSPGASGRMTLGATAPGHLPHQELHLH